MRELQGDPGGVGEVDRECEGKARLVVLGASDRPAYQTSKEQAQALGLRDFFTNYSRYTGTIAVLGCDSNDVIAMLAGEREIEKYRIAIAEARHES